MSCESHHHCWDFNSKKAKKPTGSFSSSLGCVRPTRKQGNYSCFILFVIVVIFSIKLSQGAFFTEQYVGEAWRGRLRALPCVR